MQVRSYLLLLFSITLFLHSACNEGRENKKTIILNDSLHQPLLVFEELIYDFGTIEQGEKVAHAFGFSNQGTGDLLITNAKGSCGCTVPSYPTQPIPPGKNAVVDVVFDSEGKSGIVEKKVTLTSNNKPSVQTITIKAIIIVSK